MGWRYRKRINIGPLRINFSKSGIGYSVGNKFFRVTRKANGGVRTTATIPGTGISHVTEHKTSSASVSSSSDAVRSNSNKHSGLTTFLVVFAVIAVLGMIGRMDSPSQTTDTRTPSTADDAMERALSIDRTPIIDAFGAVYDGAELGNRVSGNDTVTVELHTDLIANIKPASWDEIIERLEAALPDAAASAQEAGLGMVSVELYAADGTILASGYNGQIRYDAYAEILEAEAAKSAPSTSTSSAGSRTVYVTPSGSKYHYSSSCNGGNYTPTTLDNARSRGLTACKKCT